MMKICNLTFKAHQFSGSGQRHVLTKNWFFCPVLSSDFDNFLTQEQVIRYFDQNRQISCALPYQEDGSNSLTSDPFQFV